MKREILLAQLKAFQNYLENFVEDAKSHPEMKADEDTDKRFSSHFTELVYISERYEELKESIDQNYPSLFAGIDPDFGSDARGAQHRSREINFILDTIANLEAATLNQSSKNRTNNQPFTVDEIQIIHNQLDNLQIKLLETINREKPAPETAAPYIESVKSEISDLKAEVSNPSLGRKDWKNHLINTMITLTFTLAFSQEARNTIFIYFQSLFIYLQQHIFLLNSTVDQ